MAKIKLENGREVETSTLSEADLLKYWQTRDNWLKKNNRTVDPAKFDRYSDHLPKLEAEMTAKGIGFTPRRQVGSTPTPVNASGANVPEIPNTIKRADALLKTAKINQKAAVGDRDKAQKNFDNLGILADTQKDIDDTSKALAKENATIFELEAINGRRTTIIGRLLSRAKNKQHKLDKAFVEKVNNQSNSNFDFSKQSIKQAAQRLKIKAALHEKTLDDHKADKVSQIAVLAAAGITGPLNTLQEINAEKNSANNILNTAKTHLNEMNDNVQMLENSIDEMKANRWALAKNVMRASVIGVGASAALFATTFFTPLTLTPLTAVASGLAAAGTVAFLGLSNLNLPFRAIAGGLAAVATITFSPQLADMSLAQSYPDVNTAGIGDFISGFFGSPAEASEVTTIAQMEDAGLQDRLAIAEADPVVADGHGEELAAATDVALADLGNNDTAAVEDTASVAPEAEAAAPDAATADVGVVESSVTADDAIPPAQTSIESATTAFADSAASNLEDSSLPSELNVGQTETITSDATNNNPSELPPASVDNAADINTVSKAVEVASVAPEAGDMPSSQSSPYYTSEPDSYLEDIGGSYTPPAVAAAAGELPSVDPTVPLNLEAVAISLKELLNGAASDDLGAIVQISEIAGDRLDPSFMQIIAEQADASTHSDFIDSVSSAAAIQEFLDNHDSGNLDDDGLNRVFKILAEGVTEKVPGTISDTYVSENKVNTLLMKLGKM